MKGCKNGAILSKRKRDDPAHSCQSQAKNIPLSCVGPLKKALTNFCFGRSGFFLGPQGFPRLIQHGLQELEAVRGLLRGSASDAVLDDEPEGEAARRNQKGQRSAISVTCRYAVILNRALCTVIKSCSL